MKQYYIYIMANERPTLYVGVTNNLGNRIWQHKEELIEGFTKRYHLHKLVYYEIFEDINLAIHREKEIKHLKREKKLHLIKMTNPELKDLNGEIVT